MAELEHSALRQFPLWRHSLADSQPCVCHLAVFCSSMSFHYILQSPFSTAQILPGKYVCDSSPHYFLEPYSIVTSCTHTDTHTNSQKPFLNMPLSQQWHLERGGEAACGRLQVGSSGWAALDWRGTWWLPALLNVCGYVDFLWKFCHINFKPVLDVIEDFGIILVRHKSDG